MNDFTEGCAAIIVAIFLLVVLLLIQAAIALWLWGIIAVNIFGLPQLTFWQMYGLMWLIRLFFPMNYKASRKD